ASLHATPAPGPALDRRARAREGHLLQHAALPVDPAHRAREEAPGVVPTGGGPDQSVTPRTGAAEPPARRRHRERAASALRHRLPVRALDHRSRASLTPDRPPEPTARPKIVARARRLIVAPVRKLLGR